MAVRALRHDGRDVAAAALTEEGHGGEVYELTGPQLLNFADAAAHIADATHRPVAYRAVFLQDFTAAMSDDGVPDDVVGLLAYLFSEVLDGRNAHLADGVERALGRPPREFAAFPAAAADAGAWQASRRCAAPPERFGHVRRPAQRARQHRRAEPRASLTVCLRRIGRPPGGGLPIIL